MLAKRIIPCLDVRDGMTVKGINFLDIKEVGVYGAEKLGLPDVPDGHEITACTVYLANQSSSPTIPATALVSSAGDITADPTFTVDIAGAGAGIQPIICTIIT